MDKNSGIIIEEYQEKYNDQVKNVIGTTLADIDVIDRKTLPIDDEDLDKIRQIYSGKGKFWIAVKDGKLVGTVAVRDLGNNVAKLNRMFVLVNYHGSGLGQELLNTALLHVRLYGFNKIVLNTHVLMHRAHRFYEKNGFIRKEQKENRYFYELILG